MTPYKRTWYDFLCFAVGAAINHEFGLLPAVIVCGVMLFGEGLIRGKG